MVHFRLVDKLVREHVYFNANPILDYLQSHMWDGSYCPLQDGDIENEIREFDEYELKNNFPKDWKVWAAETFEEQVQANGLEDVEETRERFKSMWGEDWEWSPASEEYDSFREFLLGENIAHEDDLQEYQEVFTWYAVSDWLCYQLKQRGEVVIDSHHTGCYWGRTTFGQLIVNDDVIIKIAEENEKMLTERAYAVTWSRGKKLRLFDSYTDAKNFADEQAGAVLHESVEIEL